MKFEELVMDYTIESIVHMTINLLVSDIPDIVKEFREQYSVTRNGEFFGPITNAPCDHIGQELDYSIKSMIQENKWTTGVLCIAQAPDTSLHSRLQGGSACALLVTKNNFYVFDSHSRDRNGKIESGTAVLLHFTNLKQCCSHILELGFSLNCNYYEITIINVRNLCIETYLNDQKRKQKNVATTNDYVLSHTEKKGNLSNQERQALRCEKNHLQMIKKCD